MILINVFLCDENVFLVNKNASIKRFFCEFVSRNLFGFSFFFNRSGTNNEKGNGESKGEKCKNINLGRKYVYIILENTKITYTCT